MSYQHILLSVDLNAEASWSEALPAALNMCKVSGATLHLVNVVPDFEASVAQFFPQKYEQGMLDDARSSLEAFARERVPEDQPVQCIVAQGSVYHEIMQAAEHAGAELIVMASHHPSARDYLLGHNSDRVARHFKGSVLIVRDRAG